MIEELQQSLDYYEGNVQKRATLLEDFKHKVERHKSIIKEETIKVRSRSRTNLTKYKKFELEDSLNPTSSYIPTRERSDESRNPVASRDYIRE